MKAVIANTTPKTTPRKPRKCACGCGEKTHGGIFRQGHDSTLKSKLIRRIRHGGKMGEKAEEKMKSLGWALPKLRNLVLV